MSLKPVEKILVSDGILEQISKVDPFRRASSRARRLMAGHLAEIEKEFVEILYKPTESTSVEANTIVQQ